MEKINHAKESWQAKGGFVLNPSQQNKNYGKYVDKDGLSAEKRKRVEDYKNKKLYPEDEDLL